jgi:hypothetical protein
MAPQFQDQMRAAKIHRSMGVSQYSICNGLPRGKGLATHRRVDGMGLSPCLFKIAEDQDLFVLNFDLA